MGKNIGKYISINLSGKYTRDILDSAKQSATNAFKTFSKKKKKKTNSEIVQNEYDHEKPKERLYLQKKDRKLLKIWD